jgi:hypothetical protein
LAATPAPVSPSPSEGRAVTALVCGILSVLIVPLIPIALAAGIIAIVLGARYRASTGPQDTGRGMATAGLITGIIGTSLSVVVALVLAALLTLLPVRQEVIIEGPFKADEPVEAPAD